MRAKLQIVKVESDTANESYPHEKVEFMAVTEKPFDQASGISEDNEFSKWTPTANLSMTITNPALFGTLVQGEKYYVDFIKADA